MEHAIKQGLPWDSRNPASEAREGSGAARESAARADEISRYCPVCSQRLEPRRCKLICSQCGYYMSCADYY